MGKINKQQLEKIVLYVISCIISLLFMFNLAVRPNVGRIKKLSKDIKEQRRMTAEAEETAGRLKGLKAGLESLKAQIKKYHTNMPEAAPEWFLEKLNLLAGETGISFERITPQGYIGETDNYRLQGIYLEFYSGYHAVGRFINRLENLSPFLNILDITIQSNEDDPKRHITALTLGAYVAKE